MFRQTFIIQKRTHPNPSLKKRGTLNSGDLLPSLLKRRVGDEFF